VRACASEGSDLTQIQVLAETFTDGILAAIRNASLEDILAGEAPAKRGGGRSAPKASGGGQPEPLGTPGAAKRGKGRLARRSASDIEHVVGRIVAKLREHKAGLRSEQLQKMLKLDKKEITRPLEQALAAKKITKKGQKRSTTYFAK
jgi:hypothetical protein